MAMRARDIMTREVVTVRPETPVVDVIRLLLEHRISGVPVVGDDGRVVGIVSESDLMLRERAARPRTGMAYLFQQLFEDHARLAEEYRKAHGLVASEVMTHQVVTVTPGTPVVEIAHLLAERQIRRVPVVDDGKLVGIVSRADVLKAAAKRITELETADSEPLDDEGIAAALVEALRREPWAEPERIRVAVRDGVVTLSGLVENVQEREAIGLAARQIPGVREVVNDLTVRPEEPLD